MGFLERGSGWCFLAAFRTSSSGRAGPTAPAGLLPLQKRVPILPSVLSAGLWEVPATEAVYSGVHPCLERAQRGDGGGEEVHSEVGLPADPSPPRPVSQLSFSPEQALPRCLESSHQCSGAGSVSSSVRVSWSLLTTCGLRHLLTVWH